MKLLLLTAGLLIASIAQLGAQGQPRPSAPNAHANAQMAASRPAVAPQTASAMLARQPGRFTENRGQWNPEARFLMKQNGVNIWLTNSGAVYDLYQRTPASARRSRSAIGMAEAVGNNGDGADEVVTVSGHVLRLEFLGASPKSHAVGTDNLGTRTNYFLGQDRSKWGTDCQSFGGARLHNIYPGIDAQFYLDEGFPRYDLIVAPEANPAQIRYRMAGADRTELTPEGCLSICTSLGQVELRELFAYQELPNGTRQQIPCEFVVDADGAIGFAVGRYDRSRTLVIDPLIYSTFIGGSGNDEARGVALDVDGNIWVAGQTIDATTDYPTTTGAYTTTHAGLLDAFIAELDPSASGAAQLAYSTFIGGSQGDFARALAIDGNGKIWITGGAREPFPKTSGDYDVSPGAHEIFVAQIDPSASGAAQLAYSVMIGGSGYDEGSAIVVDGNGNAWVTGTTTPTTTNYPTTTGAYNETNNGGGGDAFLAKFDPSASGTAQLAYSTFLGGSDTDIGYDLLLDGDENVWIVGFTTDGTTDYPTTTGAYDQTQNGLIDIFVTKMDPSASGAAQLAYSTFLGGSASEIGYEIALDATGNVWVVGYTSASGSPSYPTTTGAYDQSFNGGGGDVVVTKLDPSVSGAAQLVYSTFIGGDGLDVAEAIVVDRSGYPWITGYTQDGTTDYPVTGDAYDGLQNGGYDAFLSRINPSASGAAQLAYSTLLGGSADDYGYDLTLDGKGSFYIVGKTANGTTDLPTTAGAYDVSQNGGEDAFVVQLGVCNAGGILDIALSPEIIWSPNDAMQTINAVLTILQGCSATATLQSITGDEAITGDVANATTGTADIQFDLRAERDRGGDGRIYTITYRLTDGVLTEDYSAKIVVPYNQGTTKVGGTSSCGTVALGAIPTFTGSAISIPYKLGGSGGAVTLRILNTRGREVARLINGATQASGDHTATFGGVKSIGSYPGSDLPNGLYLVVLEGCGFSDVGLMEIAVP